MGMTTCNACSKELSSEAKTCPSCGHPNKVAQGMSGLGIVAAVLFSALVFLFVVGSISSNNEPSFSQKFDKQFLNTLQTDYNTAKEYGDTMKMCVNAGFIAAQYLSRQDKSNYEKWKATEDSDCARAY